MAFEPKLRTKHYYVQLRQLSWCLRNDVRIDAAPSACAFLRRYGRQPQRNVSRQRTLDIYVMQQIDRSCEYGLKDDSTSVFGETGVFEMSINACKLMRCRQKLRVEKNRSP
jgi:hypothetical protein